MTGERCIQVKYLLNTNTNTSLHNTYAFYFFLGFLSLGDEVVTYEDVMQLMPDPSRKRPIVLVGTYVCCAFTINSFQLVMFL